MANDFSGDSDFIAIFNMENGALGTDSIGSWDMTLDNSNAPSSNTLDFKQGSGSGEFDLSNSEGMQQDAFGGNIAADLPFQNDSTRTGTLFCWFKTAFISGASDQNLGGRFSNVVGGRAFMMFLRTSDTNYPGLGTGYNNGGSNEFNYLSHAITANVWNHLAMSYDVSDDSFHIRLYDGNDSTVYDTTGTTSNAMDLQNNTWEYSIGARGNAAGFFDGLIDEFGFCKRVLTNDEIDQIRAGTFGAAPAGGSALFLGSNF